MKKIIITGLNSYIGTSFEKWVSKYNGMYKADSIDMRNSSWKKKGFSGYDSVLHVAGIAHSDSKKINNKQKALYYAVNTKLAVEVAQRAKDDGVKQFIYMSSIIVYGESGSLGKNKIINRNTAPFPTNCYGDSKLQAENEILKLVNENFKVVIIRSPMVYGKSCHGNYPTLAKMAVILPVFPDLSNQRSMIYIDNLTEFIRLAIENEENGIFFPQNSDYVETSKMVKVIADLHNHKIFFTKHFNYLLILLSKKISIINKVFGNLTYDKSISEYKDNYQIVDFETSIKMCL